MTHFAEGDFLGRVNMSWKVAPGGLIRASRHSLWITVDSAPKDRFSDARFSTRKRAIDRGWLEVML
jgi:hypothetical protein